LGEVIGLITARGGSKSMPRKNILPLAGKPLIAWTIEAARSSRFLSRVLLSTDDPEIAEVAAAWGAEIPFMRPAELAGDTTPHVLVVEHAIRWLEEAEGSRPEYVLMLQPTSPLRTAEDIDGVITFAWEREAIAVVSVSPMDRHPYLSKRILADGTLAEFVTSDIAYLRRQDLPPAYALNGALYLNRSDSLLCDHTFVPPGALAYVMPPERSLDVDTPWDFHLVEMILQDRS
jgi:CMP-N,N'-diacetyllegionaminic acid synthase